MREYFSIDDMSKEDFRALQLKVLDILLYFDKFCRKHSLRYYLAGGTLIGAVRHGGFIPWDEDIDVHMPRPDYERLPELWEKFAEKDRYVLCRTDENFNFHHHASSIVDINTTFIEKRNINEDIPQGIPMDILPFDGCPKGKLARKNQLFWAFIFAVYNVQRLPENQGGFLMKNGTALALQLIKNPNKRYKLWKIAENHMKKYDFDNSPLVKELVAPLHSMLYTYPRKKFTDKYLVKFEGYNFPAQHYFKDYLEKVYGNYMELPPKEQQMPKTRLVYLNLDKGYRDYKGIYYCTEKKQTKNIKK